MSESRPIRLMIVDDHVVVRDGLKMCFLAFEDIALIGEASGGEEALALCQDDLPDVILMDMVMPGLDGAAATRAIRDKYPDVQVVILTGYSQGELVQRALAAGAIAYLLKGVSVDKVAEAIRSAYVQRPTLSSAAVDALVRARSDEAKPGKNLSRRELEVLTLVAQGLSNGEIGRNLGISVSTARQHVSAVIAKLGASNRAHAAALAVRYDLIS